MGAVVLVGVTSTGMDKSMSTTWMDDWEERRLDLAISSLDDPCFAFFPQQLGRFPKSSVLDKFFLLSPVEGCS